MRTKWLLVTVALLALAFLAACGAQQQATPQQAQAPAGEQAAAAGNPERGRQLFQSSSVAGLPGCAACHSLEPGTVLVGPSLAGIGTRAAQRVPGMSAEEYLRQSILEPDAYVVEGFPKGAMPAYRNISEQDLQDLIAFLLTLK